MNKNKKKIFTEIIINYLIKELITKRKYDKEGNKYELQLLTRLRL